MEERVRAHVFVSGRVQGVAFRLETRRAAGRIGVCGWVRNLPDGRVEAVIEGERRRVEEMIAWCRRGPALARVESLALSWEPPTGEFTEFAIVR
ncbi:MAG: acylphosphatase [Desulfobacterales bacterium]